MLNALKRFWRWLDIIAPDPCDDMYGATWADLMDEPTQCPACPKVGAERMSRMFGGGGVNRG
jgi:hypothetical protein